MNAEQLNDMRKRVLNHEPYTKEEFAEAVRTMVAERIKATSAPTGAKKKSTTLPVHSLDSLL